MNSDFCVNCVSGAPFYIWAGFGSETLWRLKLGLKLGYLLWSYKTSLMNKTSFLIREGISIYKYLLL